MDGGQQRHHGVEEALGNFLAVCRGDGIRVHVDSHVPNQEQASPRQCEFPSGRCDEALIRIQASVHRAATFFKGRFERPFHDAAPMAIDRDLVGGIDRGYGVLAVLDGCDRRLQQDVFHARRMRFADGMVSIELNLDARAVIAQQDAAQFAVLFLIAGKFARVRQTHRAATLERRGELFFSAGVLEKKPGDV